MLRPMEYLSRQQMETEIAHQIVKDATKEGIPLCADVEQTRTGPPTVVVLHYDYGRDLSLSEATVVRSLVRVSAEKHGATPAGTLDPCRWAFDRAEYDPFDDVDDAFGLDQIVPDAQAAVDKYNAR